MIYIHHLILYTWKGPQPYGRNVVINKQKFWLVLVDYIISNDP